MTFRPEPLIPRSPSYARSDIDDLFEQLIESLRRPLFFRSPWDW
jgi:hypothetical protein